MSMATDQLEISAFQRLQPVKYWCYVYVPGIASVLRKNLASAKIVKIEFNANLDLLGFPHFITYKECRKVP